MHYTRMHHQGDVAHNKHASLGARGAPRPAPCGTAPAADSRLRAPRRMRTACMMWRVSHVVAHLGLSSSYAHLVLWMPRGFECSAGGRPPPSCAAPSACSSPDAVGAHVLQEYAIPNKKDDMLCLRTCARAHTHTTPGSPAAPNVSVPPVQGVALQVTTPPTPAFPPAFQVTTPTLCPPDHDPAQSLPPRVPLPPRLPSLT